MVSPERAGAQVMEPAKLEGEKHESAKEAESDARKRALMTFENHWIGLLRHLRRKL